RQIPAAVPRVARSGNTHLDGRRRALCLGADVGVLAVHSHRNPDCETGALREVVNLDDHRRRLTTTALRVAIPVGIPVREATLALVALDGILLYQPQRVRRVLSS